MDLNEWLKLNAPGFTRILPMFDMTDDLECKFRARAGTDNISASFVKMAYHKHVALSRKMLGSQMDHQNLSGSHRSPYIFQTQPYIYTFISQPAKPTQSNVSVHTYIYI